MVINVHEPNLIEKYGRTYAVCTGESDYYATELAKRGFHIILVGKEACKNAEKLKNKYIFNEILSIPCKDLENIEEDILQIKKYNVSILLNNASYRNNKQQKFHEIDP